MVLKIDFNSDEAIYIQLRNQIIMGIATDMIREGDTLPSVRQMADHIGINMHTVNKAGERALLSVWILINFRPLRRCARIWMWFWPVVSAGIFPGGKSMSW